MALSHDPLWPRAGSWPAYTPQTGADAVVLGVPTWRTSLQAIWDIRQRFQWCQVNIRADELPPDAKEYGDLELYLAAQNEGLKLSVPGIRH